MRTFCALALALIVALLLIPAVASAQVVVAGSPLTVIVVTPSGTYTVGDLLVANTTTTLTSLVDAAVNNVLISGGAGVAPSYGKVGLTTHVSGILPTANGGTGMAFFTVSGPATSAKTFTFPNANSTVLTDNAAVTAAQGGTGATSYAVGDLLQASGATALSKLASVATGNVLISGGVTTVSSWGKVGLTTHVSGILPTANGGTGIAYFTAAGPTAARVFTFPDAAGYVATTPALAVSVTAPTIASGFGTTPSVVASNGTAAFTINVGTGGTATSGVITMPTATTGWICAVNNLTAAAAHVAYNTRQTASSTTSVTVENQTTSTGAAVAWAASNILYLSCSAY